MCCQCCEPYYCEQCDQDCRMECGCYPEENGNEE